MIILLSDVHVWITDSSPKTSPSLSKNKDDQQLANMGRKLLMTHGQVTEETERMMESANKVRVCSVILGLPVLTVCMFSISYRVLGRNGKHCRFHLIYSTCWFIEEFWWNWWNFNLWIIIQNKAKILNTDNYIICLRNLQLLMVIFIYMFIYWWGSFIVYSSIMKCMCVHL